MNTTNIIRAVINATKYTVTAPIVKEDYGLYLLIEGADLPDIYEVDFSNEETSGSSVTMIGNSDGVLIPRQFIKSGRDVFAFLYLTGEEFGRTVYKFRIPNKLRPDRTEDEPTPEEQSIIDQAIAALNTAVEQTAADVVTTTAKAAEATTAAQTATQKASEAAESAEGTETYALRAEAAQNAAETARDTAIARATAAASSASEASASATSANSAAVVAEGYKTTAVNAAADAVTAKTAAETAQGKAEDAQTASETAQGLAESARDTAVASATSATASAESASASATTATTKASEASASASAAQTAQNLAEQAAAEALETVEGKADEDGFHPALTAGYALQLDTSIAETDTGIYLMRSADKAVGNRENNSLIGGTYVWNQLVNLAPAYIPSASNGITYSVEGNRIKINGTATMSETRTGWFGLSETTGFKGRVGHKILATTKVISGTADTGVNWVLTGTSAKTFGESVIFTLGVSSNNQSRLTTNVPVGLTVNDLVFELQVFDLTQMFGTAIADYIYGLEQATAGAGVAWFRNLFPKDYYSYNSGQLVSVNPTAHVMKDADENIIGFYPLNAELRGIPKLDSENVLYYDGDTYDADGTVTRKYGIRAYESGDESLADAITDGTNTVYKLTTPTTETADHFAWAQVVDPDGTEQYIDEREVAIPVGHVTRYPIDQVAKLDGLPDAEELDDMFGGVDEDITTTRQMLETALPTDTATGSIASFPDGSNLFSAKSVVVGIEPIQDLHGYDSPWPAGGGKNLIPFPYSSQAGTYNGVTVTVNDDGTLVFNGTATASTYFNLVPNASGVPMTAGNYILHKPVPTAVTGLNITAVKNGGYWNNATTSDATMTLDADANISFYIYIANGTALSNVKVFPMFEKGSTASDFAPYSNICPITGWTGANVVVSPTQDAQDGTTYNVDWQTEAGTVYGGTLDVVSGELVVDRVNVDMGTLTWSKASVTYGRWSTTLSDIKRTTSGSMVMEAIAEQYKAVSSNAYNNVVGTMYVTPNGTTLNVCNGDSSNSPSGQFVYKLDTPIVYNLTPTEVSILLGTNNVWADTGDSSVTYKADVQRYIEKKL